MGFSLIIDPDVRRDYINKAGGIYNGVFSFLENGNRIYPFSKSLEKFINNDSGLKSLNKNNYSEFLKSMPAMQFRAYYPNTVLNEIFSLLGKMGFKGNLVDFSVSSIEEFFKDAQNILKGLARPNASKTIAKNIVENISGLPSLDGSDDDAIMKLPYALYYKLVTTKTNAAYEVPCQIPSGFFDSDGNYGWGSGEDVDIFNAGGFLKRIASTFHLTMMPFFNPGNGGESESLNVKFDLINDTDAAAKANYTFIQTLILNNKWLQYGITQIPGSLYDVKIPGGQRFFMCTGNFKVSYKGVLRSTGLLGSDFKPYGAETKIPDAYSLDLTFKNLLPSNLNNYLFGLAKKNEVLQGSGKETGIFTEIANNLYTALKNIGEKYANDVAEQIKKFGNTAIKNTTNIQYLDNLPQEEMEKVLNSAGSSAGQAAVSAKDSILNDPKELDKINSATSEEEKKKLTDALNQRADNEAEKAFNETFNTTIENSKEYKEAIKKESQHNDFLNKAYDAPQRTTSLGSA